MGHGARSWHRRFGPGLRVCNNTVVALHRIRRPWKDDATAGIVGDPSTSSGQACRSAQGKQDKQGKQSPDQWEEGKVSQRHRRCHRRMRSLVSQFCLNPPRRVNYSVGTRLGRITLEASKKSRRNRGRFDSKRFRTFGKRLRRWVRVSCLRRFAGEPCS